MHITVLCKVVDNYGDIGVAWRMSRRLKKIAPQNTISLIVDDFETFSKIENRISPVIASEEASVIARSRKATKQSIVIDGIEIFHWHDQALCHDVFSQNDGERLQIILELFQCGRPDWMEKILFEEKLNRTVQIIMIDYLTAEKYAEDFHCLKSLTRSAKVQKVNFMPGFTEATGGLIIDDEWESLPPYNKDGPILLFIYNGRGAELLPEGKPLPYMNQTDWDKMMKTCSALVIRGEETMSRACLSGIPFIWQAYPQSQEYQLVKVRALLDRMRPHFAQEDFAVVENAWLYINGGGLSKAPFEKFLSSLKILRPGFVSFAQSLRKNGDLCSNLMTFINKIAIM
jgi:hypothetical protein